MRLVVTAVAAFFSVLLSAGLSAKEGPSTKSTYAGQQQRSIKSLSAKDIDDLSNGRGWGFAKAAELNSYPGPLHALELAKELKLSAVQSQKIMAVFKRMNADARTLGREFLQAEHDLDQAFVSGLVDRDRLEELVARSAKLRGALRRVHLSAHLDMRQILSVDQIASYDRLRGYGESDNGGPKPSGGRGSSHGHN